LISNKLQFNSRDSRPGSGWRESLPAFRRCYSALLKVTAIVGFFWLWFFVYDRVNQYVSDPTRTIHLKSPRQMVPGLVQPYSAIIYVFGGLMLPALPFLYHRSWRGIRLVLCCYTLTSLLAFACYLLWPLSIVRPEYRGDNLGERLMLWVFSKDLPGNCFPSSHTYFAILAAVFVGRSTANRVTKRSTWALAVAVCATTVTSGQHYFIDVPGGVAVAFLGCYATDRLRAARGI
jgi:membrane-associated phospholipid phosphatase